MASTSSSPVLVSDVSSSVSSSPLLVNESDLSDASPPKEHVEEQHDEEPFREDLTRAKAEARETETSTSGVGGTKSGVGTAVTNAFSKSSKKRTGPGRDGPHDRNESDADRVEKIAASVRKDLDSIKSNVEAALQSKNGRYHQETAPADAERPQQLATMISAAKIKQLPDLFAANCPNLTQFFLGRRKTVLPFLAYVLITGGVLLLSDPCNISPSRRKDCGWPGISGPECVFYGRWRNFAKKKSAGPKFMIRTLCGWMSLGGTLWAVSGYNFVCGNSNVGAGAENFSRDNL